MKHHTSKYFMYGIHPCTAALNNPDRQIEEVIYSSDKILEKLPPLPRSLKTRQADKNWFDKTLGQEAVHQGIALRLSALDPLGINDLASIEMPNQLVVILDQVSDPHNVGAIIRTAAAFGAKALVMTDRHAPEETGVLAKSASGALELVPIMRYANLANAIQELKDIGFWMYGFAESGTQFLSEVKFSGKVGLIMGAEGSGMRELTKKNCDFLVKLETADQFSTLNVSNAAAIAMHQVFTRFR
ncbi:MAG: 23S rRNA (guanosine(2251)-2'-O)-methyltransferase RlmB [Candidatus Paracaedibacteraceae bacterium]|nr:23S rRNA (guanosine(2251)-2'-O)-methyltransferase RlmB [Candidatus Paracaedibacteraceae bacterium]